MAELKVEVPEDLREEIEESGIDVSNLIREVLVSKAFEIQLSKSRALQRAMFESLIAKSKLSEKDAKELADKVNAGMVKELRNKFPEL